MRRSAAGLLCALAIAAAVMLPAQDEPAWVRASDENTDILLRLAAKYDPEDAVAWGLRGFDEQISLPSPDRAQRYRRDEIAAREELQRRLAAEKDERVRQDLRILIDTAEAKARASELQQKCLIPYQDVTLIVWRGLSDVLGDHAAPARHAAAAIRLRRYSGTEPGYTPIAFAARAVIEERLRQQPALLGPPRTELERELRDAQSRIDSIGQLCGRYRVAGREEALLKLRLQLTEYQRFVRGTVLPKARTDARIPAELYSMELQSEGMDYPLEDLLKTARQEFAETQNEMRAVAGRLANERNWKDADYGETIRRLRREQLSAADVLPQFRARLADVENIIRRNHLVTLPGRPEILRRAMSGEAAYDPEPHIIPPPLIDNRREMGEFVVSAGDEGRERREFGFAAAAWAMTCELGRPGRELQIAGMVERGVSRARAYYASNDATKEGWEIYAGWFMTPFLPDDGKLIALQRRLLHVASAILAAQLQQGAISSEEANRVLREDVAVSDAFAKETAERLARSPAAPVAAYSGYRRLRELRAEIEKVSGAQFSAQTFHDFILAQGLLPPKLLRETALRHFLPARAAEATITASARTESAATSSKSR